MEEKSFKERFLEKLRSKFRLIIYNDSTYQSIWSLKLTPLKVFTYVSLISAVMIFLVIFLIASTSLKEYIPGYPKAEYREMLLKNVILVDSLENELAVRDKFFSDMRSIISGEVPKENISNNPVTGVASKVTYSAFNSDSAFQDKLLEERLNLSVQSGKDQKGTPDKLHFYHPVEGYVTDKFDMNKGHFGIDIVGKANSRISAVLGGSVLFAGWTQETGNVIYLLHDNNLTSANKHCAQLLKKTGDQVKAGEAIAIIGNSGEMSTGPHLHFELWYMGKPIDPEKYIVF
jgi:murein DD-endopeptidase MepM/ murein hydrolase activator NlpD